MTSTFIPPQMLEAVLCISYDTLRRWHRDGLLAATASGNYRPSQVNAFLASCRHNFPFVPTIEALLDGTLQLMTSTEAMTRLKIPHRPKLVLNAKKGRLHVIRLNTAWRLSEESVAAYEAALTDTSLLLRTAVAHVLGQSQANVVRLVHDNKLVSKPSPLNSRNAPITRASLLWFLPTVLPGWIPPNDWLDERLADQRPLLRKTEVETVLQLSSRRLLTLLRQRYLRYIRSANVHDYLISPASLDEYMRLRALGG